MKLTWPKFFLYLVLLIAAYGAFIFYISSSSALNGLRAGLPVGPVNAEIPYHILIFFGVFDYLLYLTAGDNKWTIIFITDLLLIILLYITVAFGGIFSVG